jgi:hypothetical protein
MSKTRYPTETSYFLTRPPTLQKWQASQAIVALSLHKNLRDPRQQKPWPVDDITTAGFATIGFPDPFNSLPANVEKHSNVVVLATAASIDQREEPFRINPETPRDIGRINMHD